MGGFQDEKTTLDRCNDFVANEKTSQSAHFKPRFNFNPHLSDRGEDFAAMDTLAGFVKSLGRGKPSPTPQSGVLSRQIPFFLFRPTERLL